MKKHRFCRLLSVLLVFGFLLGVHEGRITIWKDGVSEPWRTFPYPLIVLPSQTQAQLRRGIRIDSMEDLDRFLENLLS